MWLISYPLIVSLASILKLSVPNSYCWIFPIRCSLASQDKHVPKWYFSHSLILSISVSLSYYSVTCSCNLRFTFCSSSDNLKGSIYSIWGSLKAVTSFLIALIPPQILYTLLLELISCYLLPTLINSPLLPSSRTMTMFSYPPAQKAFDGFSKVTEWSQDISHIFKMLSFEPELFFHPFPLLFMVI